MLEFPVGELAYIITIANRLAGGTLLPFAYLEAVEALSLELH
jgi:hypothetical protein